MTEPAFRPIPGLNGGCIVAMGFRFGFALIFALSVFFLNRHEVQFLGRARTELHQ